MGGLVTISDGDVMDVVRATTQRERLNLMLDQVERIEEQNAVTRELLTEDCLTVTKMKLILREQGVSHAPDGRLITAKRINDALIASGFQTYNEEGYTMTAEAVEKLYGKNVIIGSQRSVRWSPTIIDVVRDMFIEAEDDES